MSYHHKRKSCSKKTREIIEEILQMEKADYRMVEYASPGSATKSFKKTENNGTTNQLPGSQSVTPDLEKLESYETTKKLDFEAAAIKDSLEKKKKRRNYIEFRPDYISA